MWSLLTPLSSVSTSQEIPCSGSNASGAVLPHLPSSSSGQPQADAPSSFTPTLAAHFDENLVRHIQGWPSETTEKQVRLLPLPSAAGSSASCLPPFLFMTGETSLKWSQPSFLPFPVPVLGLYRHTLIALPLAGGMYSVAKSFRNSM